MPTPPDRHPLHRLHLRKDRIVNARIDFDYRIACERQEREREIRAIRTQRSSDRDSSIRRRIGESFIRLGERLASPDPAWSR